jgi:predicted transcriptional regulator
MARKKKEFYIKRDMAIRILFSIGGMKAIEIAEMLGIDRSIVSKAISKEE